jgi:hypothetical protein
MTTRVAAIALHGFDPRKQPQRALMERALRVPPAIAPKVLELASCSTAEIGSKTDASDWYSSIPARRTGLGFFIPLTQNVGRCRECELVHILAQAYCEIISARTSTLRQSPPGRRDQL